MRSIIILGLLITSLNAFAYEYVDESGHYSAPILAGQNILSGSVILSNTDNDLKIMATSNVLTDWYIQKAHVYVSTTAPVPNPPAPGQFPYHSPTFVPAQSSYELTIPLVDLNRPTCGQKLFVALHFEMVKLRNGSVIQAETGWAFGPSLVDERRWGWQFQYTVGCNPIPPEVAGCTLTQGYWKNHSKYSKNKTTPWPKSVGSLTSSEDVKICGVSQYDIIKANPKTGNAWQILAQQYISARLNQLNGSTLSSQVNLDLAIQRLVSSCSMNVHASTALGQDMTLLGGILANYNEGLLGVPHCR